MAAPAGPIRVPQGFLNDPQAIELRFNKEYCDNVTSWDNPTIRKSEYQKINPKKKEKTQEMTEEMAGNIPNFSSLFALGR